MVTDRLRSLRKRIESNLSPSPDESDKDDNRIYLTTELLDMMVMVLAAHQIEPLQHDAVQLHLTTLAGRTLVGAAASDVWEAAKRGFTQLLGRGDPKRTERAEQVAELRLDHTREELAGMSGPELEKNRDHQAAMWATRLADLLEAIRTRRAT